MKRIVALAVVAVFAIAACDGGAGAGRANRCDGGVPSASDGGPPGACPFE